MANVKGPLFSLSATGSINKTICYKKGVRGYVARKWAKPTGVARAAQELVRDFTGERMSHWPDISAEDQLTWWSLAQSVNSSPINVYLQKNWERHIQGLGTTDVWPVFIPPPVYTYFAEGLNFELDGTKLEAAFNGDGQLFFEDLKVRSDHPENISDLILTNGAGCGGEWHLEELIFLNKLDLTSCGTPYIPSFFDLSFMFECILYDNAITSSYQIDSFLHQLNDQHLLNGGTFDIRGGTNANPTSYSGQAQFELVQDGWTLLW